MKLIRIVLFVSALAIILSCNNAGNTVTKNFDFSKKPCEYLSLDEIASVFQIEKKLISETNAVHQNDEKQCRYEFYIDSFRMVNMFVSMAQNNKEVFPDIFDNIFDNALENGYPSVSGSTLQFNYWDVQKRHIIYSKDPAESWLVWVNLDNEYLINLEIDKSLSDAESMKQKIQVLLDALL
jgi:hypothetical protein